MMKPFLYSLILVLTLAMQGCGYHFGRGELSQFSTMTIPYVEGDSDGSLTATLISELVKSGSFDYQRDDGALILLVRVVDLSDENIGFRYDRKKKGELTHSVIPTETRLTILVEVIVRETASGCNILGPVRLTASVDFDHDYYSSRNGINIFSLGQLSDIDAAYDAARKPLYDLLAKKIVDLVNDSW